MTKKPKSMKSPMLNATRFMESSTRKTTRSLKTTKFHRYVLQKHVEQVTEAPPQQHQQHSSDVAAVNEPESAPGPIDGKQRGQQRTIEQVIDVQDEDPCKETDQVQQRSDEAAVDANLDQAASASENISGREHRTSWETRIGASLVRNRGSTKVLTSKSAVSAPNARVTRFFGMTSLC